jgi:acyl-CoA hydrolase
MQKFNWIEKYKDKVGDAASAMELIKSGNSVFIGTGCGQPQYLVDALVRHSNHIYDAHIVHLLTMGAAPYTDEKFREKFKMNTFFIADNVRDTLSRGIGDYTPIFLSEIPFEFETGRIPIDVALISVSPPDVNGLCSLGVSVDIIKSAVTNARYTIAQVNSRMPRTFGDSLFMSMLSKCWCLLMRILSKSQFPRPMRPYGASAKISPGLSKTAAQSNVV